MSFRNIRHFIPKEDRTCTLVQLVGDDFKEVSLNKSLPSSSDYSLKDMLAAGIKVQPVDPTIIHDSSATSAVADAFINQADAFINQPDNKADSNVNVEPSNND